MLKWVLSTIKKDQDRIPHLQILNKADVICNSNGTPQEEIRTIKTNLNDTKYRAKKSSINIHSEPHQCEA